MRFIIALFALTAASMSALAQEAPQFRPEPFWPKALPDNWILGQVAGLATDRNDNVWIVHRPGSLLDDEKGATAESTRYQVLQGRAAGDAIRCRRKPAALLGRARPGL